MATFLARGHLAILISAETIRHTLIRYIYDGYRKVFLTNDSPSQWILYFETL